MIYNKPQDITLRRLPSPGSIVEKRTKKFDGTPQRKAPSDNSIKATQTAPHVEEAVLSAVATEKDYDIIIRDRYVPAPESNSQIFDLNAMPLISGIPILTLPNEEVIFNTESADDDTALIFTDATSVNRVVANEEKRPEDTRHTVSEDGDIDLSALPVDSEIPMLEFKSNKKSADVSAPPYVEPIPRKKEKENSEKSKSKKELSLSFVKKGRRFKIASFFIILYLGAVLAFAIPLRPTYSESEKRSLTSFPEFSVDSLISGNYFDTINTWFADTFPYREQLTQINTRIKSLYGIETVAVHGDIDSGDEIPDAPIVIPDDYVVNPPSETNNSPTSPTTPENYEDVTPEDKADVEVQQLGAIVVAGDSAYEYYGYSEEVAVGFVAAINRLESLTNPTGNVYTMIIPTSMDITLDDSIRKQITSTANQKNAIDLFNKSFKNCICVDGIYDAERAHRDEYIYFRTDHHWTALGAYYAYEQFAAEKGITPVPLADYPVKSFSGFLGTFYSSSGQSPAMKANPDTVTAYLPINDVDCSIITHMGDTPWAWPVINDVSDYSSGMKYLTFIGGDNALTTITNNDNPDGGTCIVIKDSYGNAFVPFLIPHYSTVYVIDPRYYTGALSDFCSDKEIEDVIFLTNISATRNYIYLEGLQNIAR